VELRHLRYFIRAAELLHFTKAAESLYISQPTLSTHIQQLEEELNCELFARIGRKVQLTESGKLLLIHARKAVQEVESAAAEIDATTGLLRGNLVVATLPAWSSRLLPGWITAFNSIHPDVMISARSVSFDDVEAGLLDGEISLAFAFVPSEHPEITGIELFTDEIVAVIPRGHSLFRKTKLEASDLHRLPMALPGSRSHVTRRIINNLAEQGVEPKVVVYYDDGLALLEIARLGGLVTLLPESAVRKDSDLNLLPLPTPGLRATIGALATNFSPAARAFLAVAQESVKYLKGVKLPDGVPDKVVRSRK
jgi:DNA-binding transcriptional LysR family regulator